VQQEAEAQEDLALMVQVEQMAAIAVLERCFSHSVVEVGC